MRRKNHSIKLARVSWVEWCGDDRMVKEEQSVNDNIHLDSLSINIDWFNTLSTYHHHLITGVNRSGVAKLVISLPLHIPY